MTFVYDFRNLCFLRSKGVKFPSQSYFFGTGWQGWENLKGFRYPRYYYGTANLQ